MGFVDHRHRKSLGLVRASDGLPSINLAVSYRHSPLQIGESGIEVERILAGYAQHVMQLLQRWPADHGLVIGNCF